MKEKHPKFIGRIDNNGVRIYEGSLVSFVSDDDSVLNGTVRYDNGLSAYVIIIEGRTPVYLGAIKDVTVISK